MRTTVAVRMMTIYLRHKIQQKKKKTPCVVCPERNVLLRIFFGFVTPPRGAAFIEIERPFIKSSPAALHINDDRSLIGRTRDGDR